MDKTNNLQHFLTDLADTIRTVEGSSEPINAQTFSTRIASFSTGGGGVPIVGSIEELEALDLPIGSLAVVASEFVKTSLADVYVPSEKDFVIDQENAYAKLNNADALTHIKGIELFTPSDSWQPPQNLMFLGIMLNKYVVDILAGGVDMNSGGIIPEDDPNAAMGLLLVGTMPLDTNDPNSPTAFVVGGVCGGPDVLNSMGQLTDVIFAQYTTETGFTIDTEKFNTFINQLESDDFYFLMPLVEGGIDNSESDKMKEALEYLRVLDEIIKLSSSATPQVYIKESGWEELHSSEISSIVSKITSTQNLIPKKISQLENDSNYLTNQYINPLVLYGTDITITNNRCIELVTINQTVNVSIDESDGSFYNAQIIYYQTHSGASFIINGKEVVYNDGPGKYLLEINKLSDEIIVHKSTYLGEIDFAYLKIELNSDYRSDYYLGTLNGEYVRAYKNGSLTHASNLELGAWMYKGTVYEIYFKGTYTVRLSNKKSNTSGSEYFINANMTFLNFGNENNKINFIKYTNTNYRDATIKLVTDCSVLDSTSALRVSDIEYVEGVKHVNIPLYKGYDNFKPNVVLPNSVENLSGLYENQSQDNVNFTIGFKDINKLWNFIPSNNKGKFNANTHIYELNNSNLELKIPNKIKFIDDINNFHVSNIQALHFHNELKCIDLSLSYFIKNYGDIKYIYLPDPFDWNPRIKELSSFNKVNAFRYVDFYGNVSKECDYLQIQNTLYVVLDNVENFTVPEDIEIIDHAFYYNKNIKNVILHPKVKTITNSAFSSSTVNIINLDDVKSIERSAFSGANGIKYLDFSKVENIEGYAFYNCSSKYYNFYKNKTVPVITDTSFKDSEGIIIVPQSLYEEWVIAKNWDALVDKIVPVTKPIQFSVEENYCIAETGYT